MRVPARRYLFLFNRVHQTMTDAMLRQAHASDLDALVQLENRCFTEDRISRRSFRRFLEMPRDRLQAFLGSQSHTIFDGDTELHQP